MLGVECIVGRYRRSQERKERVLESAWEPYGALSFVDCSGVDGEEVGEVDMDSSCNSSKSCQTHCHRGAARKFNWVQSLRTENQVLKGKVERLTNDLTLLDRWIFLTSKKTKKLNFIQYRAIINTSLVNFAFSPSFLVILFANEKKLYVYGSWLDCNQ